MRSVLMVVGGLATLLWLTFAPYTHPTLSPYYAEALGAAQIETRVRVGFIEYEVTGSEVRRVDRARVTARESSEALRLAYAQALAERSPLLALAGSNPHRLAEEVGHLRQRALEVAAVVAKDDAREALTALYPTSFLLALADLERARVAFVASGSSAHGRIYNASLREALRTWEKDYGAFKTGFDANWRDYTIHMYTSKTKSAALKDAVDAIAQQYQRTSERVARRELCVEGDPQSCDASDLLLPIPSAMPYADISRLDPLRTQARNVLSIYTDAELLQERGSVVALSANACFPGSDYSMIWLQDPHADVLRGIPSVFVGDIYLQKTISKQTVNNFAKLGLRISYGPLYPFLFYRCLDKGYLLSRALATARTADFARSHAGVAVGERARLLSGGIPHVSDAIAYLRTALGSPLPDNDQRAELITIALMFRDGGAGVDMLAHEVQAAIALNLAQQEKGLPFSRDPAFFFMNESSFLNFFQTYNPSFGGAPRQTHEEVSKQEIAQRVIRYSQAGDSSRAAIVESLRSFELYKTDVFQ